MRAALEGGMATYFLPVGGREVAMNPLVGGRIGLRFGGLINDIATGKRIKKSYQNGYSYESMTTLARCDLCMVKPELCHYERGTCREPDWGRANCFVPHTVYLALSSRLKVGITRDSNIPGRWIDQGAIRALPIVGLGDRLGAGLVEVELAREYDDKTDWRKMVRGECEDRDVDLEGLRERIFDGYGDLLDDMGAEDLDAAPVEIGYPVVGAPKAVKSLSLDKEPIVEGRLLGIRGQYLIFEHGVLSVRRHQGYFLEVEY